MSNRVFLTPLLYLILNLALTGNLAWLMYHHAHWSVALSVTLLLLKANLREFVGEMKKMERALEDERMKIMQARFGRAR